MLNLYNGAVMTNNRKLQFLLETKLSTDDKVPKTGRVLRNKIFVIGFPPNCTEMDLERFFSNFGPVREARIVKNETGITKGYAFITFAKERSVMHALEYRGPLYFMDRKLSINPAIKKEPQFLQTEICLSSPSTSSDTRSDMSPVSNHNDDINTLTNSHLLPMISIPILPQTNTSAEHHYYNTLSQPYFHMNLPPHPIYYTSGSSPMWHHYFSTTTGYPPCTYLSIVQNSGEYPISTHINAGVCHNSMIQPTHMPGYNKNLQ